MNRSHAAVTAVSIAVGILLGRSVLRAADVEIPGAASPVFFHGELSDAAGPVTGERAVAVNIWKSADATVATNRVCADSPAKVAVVKGSFEVALSATCISTLRLLSRGWYELVVDGVRFPLQPIGAVPFVVTATTQPRSGSRLLLVHGAIEAEDGTYIPDYYPAVFDTKLGLRCTWFEDRCFPEGVLAEPITRTDFFFEDAACTKRPAADVAQVIGSAKVGQYGLFRVAGKPAVPFRVTAAGPLYNNGDGTCRIWNPSAEYHWVRYTELPLTDFVAKKK
jgi:hypothetical protein